MTGHEDVRVLADPQGVLARVRASYSSLPEAERRVADALAVNPEDVVKLPVRALAQQIGVGEATIIRFCRSLGFSGLRDFKLALAAETFAPHRIIHDAISPRDDLTSVVTKVLGSDMQAIADTLAILDMRSFAEAVDAILGASRVELYAIGSSVPVALDAHYRLLRIGLPVTIATDPHMQALSASQLPPGAVALAISHIGRSAEIRTALLRARTAEATTILLTSHAHSPLGEHADIQLVTASPSSTLRPEAVASRIAHLALVDALSVVLAMKRPDQAREWLVRDDAIIAEREIKE
jgi:RpiR family carbohydrate utilization transcriptional regulator